MDRISVGRAEIHRIEELSHRMPIAAITQDEAFIASHAGWLRPDFLEPDDHWTMVFQSWILVHDGKIIVVDPCTGNGRPSPAFPLFDNLDTPFIERFAATGIRPDQVDYVFCTHLHSDHCGWNTRMRDGRYVPTFPNARYVIVQREYDHWNPARPGYVNNPMSDRSIFENSIAPVVDAGLAELVANDHRIMPGVRVAPAHGHTAGHSVLHLETDEAAALFTGDCFHHPIELIRPDFDMGACEDFPTALATRRRLIDYALHMDALIVPAHFPAPYAGRLRREGGEVRFVALGA